MRVHCGPISSPLEYEKVLKLRKDAYLNKKDSKIKESTALNNFKDEFDDYSYISVIKLGTEVIASCRCVFNFGNNNQSEISRLGFEIPSFIEKGKYAEASRFATNRHYRGKDLFFMLLGFTFRSAIITGHRYLLADCEDHLLPVYKKWGAISLNKKIVHKWENISLNAVYFDLQKIVKKAKWTSYLPFLPSSIKMVNNEVFRLSDDPIASLLNKK